MKTLAALTFATAIAAGLALAQTRRTSLVKGSPTNYGTNGLRSISLMPLLTASLGSSGKASTRAPSPAPIHPKTCATSKPNGVLTDNRGHVWAGDGAGNIIGRWRK